jgi:hypothetical protein
VAGKHAPMLQSKPVLLPAAGGAAPAAAPAAAGGGGGGGGSGGAPPVRSVTPPTGVTTGVTRTRQSPGDARGVNVKSPRH